MTDIAILLTYIWRKHRAITSKMCAWGCARALMLTQTPASPWSPVHADPYIFVPTRAQGRAACVNVHISLIITRRNLQAGINRRRNYLGREIERGNRGRGRDHGCRFWRSSEARIRSSSIIFCTWTKSMGWTWGTGEKVVLQDSAPRGLCLHIGRRQRVHICWRVCRRGGGGGF